MKPSHVCRLAGLKGMKDLSDITGESTQTLTNWYKNKPERFMLILKGVMFDKNMQTMKSVVETINSSVATVDCID